MADNTANERQIAMRDRDLKADIEYIQFRCEKSVMDIIRARAKKRGKSLSEYLRSESARIAAAIQRQDAAEQNTLQRQQPQK